MARSDDILRALQGVGEGLAHLLPSLRAGAATSLSGLNQALTQTVQRLTGETPGGGVAGNRAFLHEALAELAEGPNRIREALWGVAQAQVAYNHALATGTNAEKMAAAATLERAMGRHQAETARYQHAEARYQMRERAAQEAQAETGPIHKLSRVVQGTGLQGGRFGQLLEMGRGIEMASAGSVGGVVTAVMVPVKWAFETFMMKMKLMAGGLQHSFNALTATNFDDTVRESADALSDLAGSMDPALGGFARMALALPVAILDLKDFSSGLLDANLRLQNFSGAMAVVGAQHQVRTIMREMQQGNRQADSASHLQQALDDLKDTLAPLDSHLENFKNELFAKLTELANSAIKPAADALDKAIGELWKQLTGGLPDVDTSRSWWDSLGDMWPTTDDRPPGFPPGVNR